MERGCTLPLSVRVERGSLPSSFPPSLAVPSSSLPAPLIVERGRPLSSFPPSLAPFLLGAASRDGGVRVGGTEGHDGGDEGGGAAWRGGHHLTSVAVRQGSVD
jgi:hypothetical protein